MWEAFPGQVRRKLEFACVARRNMRSGVSFGAARTKLRDKSGMEESAIRNTMSVLAIQLLVGNGFLYGRVVSSSIVGRVADTSGAPTSAASKTALTSAPALIHMSKTIHTP